ncbi:MAG: phytoene/squalene synthase family protein [Bdellovibrionales bacterium]|jgi:phytoene synthase|nr:phytoene/squalene synthase family protein [Bdellovibrionales bacterium]
MSEFLRDELTTTKAAKSDIQKGSKSFSFASLVFSKKEREACWRLYAWCRRSDDAIDGAASRVEAVVQLQELKTKTRACFRGEDLGEHPWTGLKEIAVRYRISEQAALDLLRGFETDLGDERPLNGISVQMKSWDDLADYCYCVAGTVGLMMCPIMGVKNPDAAKAAIAMGSAMQLTNISRDVREDFERGRVYLPADWLLARGVKPHELLNTENRKAVFSVVQQMLDKAEDMYAMGEAGLRYLPWRAAWAVLVAAFVYREIGRQVLAKGSDTDFKRVVVGRSKKLILFLQASVQLLKWRLVGYGPDRMESLKGQTNGINILPS